MVDEDCCRLPVSRASRLTVEAVHDEDLSLCDLVSVTLRTVECHLHVEVDVVCPSDVANRRC